MINRIIKGLSNVNLFQTSKAKKGSEAQLIEKTQKQNNKINQSVKKDPKRINRSLITPNPSDESLKTKSTTIIASRSLGTTSSLSPRDLTADTSISPRGLTADTSISPRGLTADTSIGPKRPYS